MWHFVKRFFEICVHQILTLDADKTQSDIQVLEVTSAVVVSRSTVVKQKRIVNIME